MLRSDDRSPGSTTPQPQPEARFSIWAVEAASFRRSLEDGVFVYFRFTFLGPLREDIKARRCKFTAFDLSVLAYFP
jgi:hypothetical protein